MIAEISDARTMRFSLSLSFARARDREMRTAGRADGFTRRTQHQLHRGGRDERTGRAWIESDSCDLRAFRIARGLRRQLRLALCGMERNTRRIISKRERAALASPPLNFHFNSRRGRQRAFSRSSARKSERHSGASTERRSETVDDSGQLDDSIGDARAEGRRGIWTRSATRSRVML